MKNADKKLDQIITMLGDVVDVFGKRFDKIDDRFDKVDDRFDKLDDDVAAVKNKGSSGSRVGDLSTVRAAAACR